MSQQTIPLLQGNLDNLSQAPHNISQLIDLITGKQQLTAVEQEQRWQHLSHCLPCQMFLGTYLLEMLAFDNAHGNPVENTLKLLTRLQLLIHETLKEEIPAYAELLEEEGEESANAQIPWLAAHLETCKDCTDEVHTLLAWIRAAAVYEWV